MSSKLEPGSRRERDLAEIGEIPPRSCQHVCEFLNLGEISEISMILPRSHHDVCDLSEIAARFSTSRRDLGEIAVMFESL